MVNESFQEYPFDGKVTIWSNNYDDSKIEILLLNIVAINKVGCHWTFLRSVKIWRAHQVCCEKGKVQLWREVLNYFHQPASCTTKIFFHEYSTVPCQPREKTTTKSNAPSHGFWSKKYHIERGREHKTRLLGDIESYTEKFLSLKVSMPILHCNLAYLCL